MATIPQDAIAPTVSAQDLTALQQAVAHFDRTQLIWSSGFLAGLAGSTVPDASVTNVRPAAAANAVSSGQTNEWHIFYATETGNSRCVAETLAAEAAKAGLGTTLQDLRDVRPKVLKRVNQAVFVIATHGIGEPPEGSEAFFEFWLSDKAPTLENLDYSVLALGDSSYADFCDIGRRFDARLRALGASTVVERIDCDLDFDTPSAVWTKSVVKHARSIEPHVELPRAAHLSAVPTTHAYDRQHPFDAEILARQAITGRNSSKDVRHIELNLESSGLVYQPGDSLGVMPTNSPQIVNALLDAIGCEGDDPVVIDGQTANLHEAFSHSLEITVLSRPVLDAVAATQPQLQSILDSRDDLSNYLETRQLIDLVREFPIEWQPQQISDALRRLTPRLYSIASSPDLNADEAHLTVAVVDYERFGRRHWGSASSFLTGDTSLASVYVEPNDHFRLPVDGNVPIIMVAAGTGVAPFRAFVEHRREHGHKGRNWLVFGDRTFSNDFLYQLEWLRHRRDGLLTHLDVAFSRDQQRKQYVQHRILEKGATVYGWLQQGAHVYVCGDAKYMAADVDRALHLVIAEHGGLSEDNAHTYVNELKQMARYQRDVY